VPAKWFEFEVRPRLKGRCTLIRFADDAVLAFEDVIRYLARHKAQVGPTIATHPKGGVADELIRLAKAEGADLIVAGAYGHSRLGEWAFGGVTRDLLASSPMCCLLSH
jgi:nucleotide-binding universal stress UspA family protein